MKQSHVLEVQAISTQKCYNAYYIISKYIFIDDMAKDDINTLVFTETDIPNFVGEQRKFKATLKEKPFCMWNTNKI